jgi:hypothetical protein
MRLSGEEHWLLFQALLLLPLIELSLRVFGFTRLLGRMEKIMPLLDADHPAFERSTLNQAKGLARIVNIAAQRGFYKATCLRKSLLVWWFMRREGILGEVRIGVRVEDNQLEGHAWVEYFGHVVNDTPDVNQKYRILQESIPTIGHGL